ncbi:MAG: metal ABC transporter permease, partial [Candidatus Hydrogenedentes bacterium]|nr:metal ABC transporter permease [Candidatus Hydrogenedentota bacterium]
MFEFWAAAAHYPMARNAVFATLLLSMTCGVVGSYVVVRRITYIAAGVAHCVLGGMGAARYLQVVYGWQFFHPIYGALIAALLAATIIGWMSLTNHEREDSAISAVWSIGMASGILFIYATPGYSQDLMGYLFGNILLVTQQHLYFIAGLNILLLFVVIRWYDEFQLVCFDEEFARTRNINVSFFYILLLLITALTV